MTYRRRLLAAAFVVVVFIGTDLLASAQTVCQNSNGNYTSNSAYSADLNATLSSLSANIGGDGFYNASAGEVNAAAMCRGDLQLEMCRDCVRTAGAQLLQSCPNQKQAVRSDDHCTLRYSNASIYGVLATFPAFYVRNMENVTSPAQFRADLRALLDNLRRKAAAGVGAPPRKVAAGNATGPDFQTIFGLVQCTPDLSSEECTSCLIDVISQIPDCCDGGSKGGRVVAPSCNVFFEIRPFYNETRLQELEFLPPPPPSLSPPVFPPSPSSSGTLAAHACSPL